MARLPRRFTKKDKVGPTSVATRAAAEPVREDNAEQTAVSSLEQSKTKIIEEFESALREQPGMDDEGLEFLMGIFRKTVDETPLDASLAPTDPADFAKTLNLLVENGVLGEDDRNDLVRHCEESFAPLRDKDVQIALEFAERLSRDGESKAMEWLEAQQQASVEVPKTAVETAGRTGVALKQSVTRSRSRRLRGPPVHS